MAGRPPKEKSFANMLRIAIAEANEDGKTALREVADALVAKAKTGDVNAIKEIADRLDGKVAQPIAGDDDLAPVGLAFRWMTSGDSRKSSSPTSHDPNSSHSTTDLSDGPASSLTEEPVKP